MQRYSIASQLENYQTFGILVSNTSASFVNKTVDRCQEILKNQNKKCFLFMMSKK
jgi:diphthamide biosynthesis enzyme Dph1/Dph2-like protein